MGEVTEQENSQKAEINQEDIKTVMEQTNVSEAEAREAIEKAEGDLAKAILNLKQ
jgi:nascent polypeptide-associated complex subunit alpha